MKNALVLHGTNGSSSHNWFPWLRKELEHRGFIVWVPDLPHAEKPSMKRYNDFIFPKWTFTSESVIVGHSSGAVAILGMLQKLPVNLVIDKAILVAGFTDNLGMPALKELFSISLDWGKIKKQARKIILYHSDNDPYVPLWHGEKLRDLLNAEFIFIKGQKHFNKSTLTKYTQFPEVLEKILE